VFDFICENLNIKEVPNKAKIYPNPVKDLLHIKSFEKIKNISFYNNAGQKIKDENIRQILILIDLSKNRYIYSKYKLSERKSSNRKNNQKIIF
jgi:hypothetical protein